MSTKNKRLYRFGLIWLPVCILASNAFLSCIQDDLKDCPPTPDSIPVSVSVSFDYSYNIKNVNAFGEEAGRVSVWLFDANGTFVEQLTDGGDHITNEYAMLLPSMPAGKYSLVAWAAGCTRTEEYADCSFYTDCIFPELTPGVSVLDDLTFRIRRDDSGVSYEQYNPWFVGVYELDYARTEPVHCTIRMMKCSNKLRILLMPAGDKDVTIEKYDFLVQDDNGWLDYRAEKYASDEILYIPYYAETFYPPEESSAESGGELYTMSVASINTSRFFYTDKARFSVIEKATGEEVFVLENLTWYLALLATLEHNGKWDEQEYLDREDYFPITIYVDGETFLNESIVIKDWLINIDDNVSFSKHGHNRKNASVSGGDSTFIPVATRLYTGRDD